jgi:tRNA threonylcarbamoyladenosine biosynthesis protein TsaB
MLILALDTTGSVCTAALAEDDRIRAEVWLDYKKTHSEGLMPMVDYLLKSIGADIADVGLFAAVTGPGSYTGIRIGVSAVKAFAQAGGKPCAAVNTLDSLCMNVPHFDGLVCPMIDARRQEVYTAVYAGGARQQEYRAIALAELLLELAGSKTLFLGDGAANYREIITHEMGETAVFASPHSMLQRASSACLIASAAAKEGRLLSAFTLEPYYLKKPQYKEVT